MRTRIQHCTAVAIATVVLGCAGFGARGGSASPRGAQTPATGNVLAVEPPDAEIAIDGRPWGPASKLGARGLVQLPPGFYQVTVSRTGYATWRAEVAIRAEPQPFKIVLERR